MVEADYISLASLVVSFGAALFSWLASQKANNIQIGVIELDLRNAIETSKLKISDISMQMAPLKIKRESRTITIEEDNILKIYEKSFDAAIQSMLNTYDAACEKYLDKKVDRVRFRKTYQVEVRNLIESEDLKRYFGVDSKYQPILKVYDIWENTC